MALTVAEIKRRYFRRKRKAAPIIACACGCGYVLKAVDNYGRPQRYINGHNRRQHTGIEATRWAVNKRWAKNNPDKIRAGKRNFYRRRKLLAMAFLGNACKFCGFKYNGKNAPAFEFHHVNPKDKDIGVTRIVSNATWEAVLKELKKCVLACANCHNLQHGGV